MNKEGIGKWVIENEISIFKNKIWDLRSRKYSNANRKTISDFYYISSPDWVVVVARTISKEILFVNQFRCGINDFSTELPGGIIDKGEEPIEAAKRELKEETGYEGKKIKSLGFCHPNPSMINNKCHFFLIDEVKLSSDGTCWDEHEEMENIMIRQEKIVELIETGQLSHSLTIAALYRLKIKEDLMWNH